MLENPLDIVRHYRLQSPAHRFSENRPTSSRFPGRREPEASRKHFLPELRSSEEWSLRCYLTMEALQAVGKPNAQLSRH
jgi:hypothetical protein